MGAAVALTDRLLLLILKTVVPDGNSSVRKGTPLRDDGGLSQDQWLGWQHELVSLADRFPTLHRPDRWDWASITMRFTTDIPDDSLVSSTHVVGFADDLVLLCRDHREDVWFLPGGTREPGESVAASLERELLEEAGARLLSAFHPIGAHMGRSDAGRPYRPHLPHPEKAWLWGWADVQVVGPPTNPDDGEVISEVAAVPLLEAARRATTDAAWAGELIMLAAECREATRRLGR